MSGKKKRPPRIPPGAPGHPREGAGEGPRPRSARKAGGPKERKAPARAAPARRPTGGRPEVGFIYEDEELIAVDKPEGLPVIAPEGGGRSLYDIVTARLRRANPRARAAVVHRLDRDTSGIVVFAKSAEAKRLVMGGWDELVAERRYVALVEGRVEGEGGLLDSWIAEAGPSRMRVAASGERGALRALTRWRLVRAGPRYSLLELKLETGRKHQIRVQLAAMGHPVAGDARYGAGSDPLGRLGLHAEVLDMTNPMSGKRFRLESPCPPSFLEAVLSRGPGRW